MTPVLHVVIGPAGHGVVRHALAVAEACGHPVVARATPEEVVAADVAGHDVVHLAVTDRLFGPTCEAAAAAFGRVADLVDAAGAAVSVTLHDLPMGASTRADRRRRAYSKVVARARGLVVASRHELALADDLGDAAWSRRVIPLPVDPVRPATIGTVTVAPNSDVVVLGFVHPDRGHEHTIAETPPGGTVVALGASATGHEDMPVALAAEARALGRCWRATGHVPDADLGDALRAAAVPVAPHRHVSASASIATWIAHGRRPLVPDTRYTRELDAAWPGTVRRYDPDVRGALCREIEAARADPARTLVAAGTPTGPTTAKVAARYRHHLNTCAPPTAMRVGRSYVVPGNRWDLLAAVPAPPPTTVSVVVPYFDAQAHLDLVLTALTHQTHPAARLQVVVADDGSPRSPDLGAAGGLDVRTVRQDDRGFRAGAARNLGAAAADGEVLAFLDGDTVPGPEYVGALSRLPALTPDALVVGRRRHAELDGVRAWLDGTVATPTPLPEPGWLADGYARSDDLLLADDRSYRYVISAVLGMHRDLFAELGGFDAAFVTYGGEDWELASRSWNAGALFAHVPDAVAWHVGPDWAGRGGREKADEDALVARLVPDPVARAGGVHHEFPRTVVLVGGLDGLATARQAVGDRDAGVWVTDSAAGTCDDPRVHVGPPPPAVLARARTIVRPRPGCSPDELAALLDADDARGTREGPGGTAWSTRALARARRWSRHAGADPTELGERLFGRRDLAGEDPGRRNGTAGGAEMLDR